MTDLAPSSPPLIFGFVYLSDGSVTGYIIFDSTETPGDKSKNALAEEIFGSIVKKHSQRLSDPDFDPPWMFWDDDTNSRVTIETERDYNEHRDIRLQETTGKCLAFDSDEVTVPIPRRLNSIPIRKSARLTGEPSTTDAQSTEDPDKTT